MSEFENCPVCGEKYFIRSLQLHITKTSGREALRYFVKMINTNKGDVARFSIEDVLKHSPHWEYHRKNPKRKSVFEL